MGITPSIQRIDIFISSPSDVSEERRIIQRVVERLNRLASIRNRYILNALAYENEVPPLTGDVPQAIVNRFMEVKNCFIMICVFGSRMGTSFFYRDVHYDSGTQYEFEIAYEQNLQTGLPHILLYRNMIPNPDASVDQKARVDTFFQQFEGETPRFQGLYKAFDTMHDFEDMVFHHIEKIVSELTRQNGENPSLMREPPIVTPQTSQSVTGLVVQGDMTMTGGSFVVNPATNSKKDRIAQLEHKNRQLTEALPSLQQQLKQARFEARTASEIREYGQHGTQSVKNLVPLFIIIMLAIIVGTITTPIIGGVTGFILFMMYFILKLVIPTNKLKNQPSLSEVAQLEDKIAKVNQQIQRNDQEITRLYNELNGG